MMTEATSASASWAAVPLPLTTTFTPPDDCTSELWLLQSTFTQPHNTTQYANLGPDNTASCLPSGWSTQSFFSPGLACPKGYSTGRNYVSAGETRATCCPVYTQSGYNWDFIARPDYDDWRPWHSILGCYYNFTTDALSQTFRQTSIDPQSTGNVVTDMISSKNGINAYGVQLRWRATDLSTAAATFGSGITSTTVAAETGTQTSSTNSSASPTSSGLSTGAKVGIGIGCAVAGILIILAGIFLFLRSRRRKLAEQGFGSNEDFRSRGPAELNGSPRTQEMDSTPVQIHEKTDDETNSQTTNPPPTAQRFFELDSPPVNTSTT